MRARAHAAVEDKSTERTDDENLQRIRHHEVKCDSLQPNARQVGRETGGLNRAEQAHQRNHRAHGEGLDAQDLEDWAVSRLRHLEREMLSRAAGHKERQQEADEPLQRKAVGGHAERRVPQTAGVQRCIIYAHDVDHQSRGEQCESAFV